LSLLKVKFEHVKPTKIHLIQPWRVPPRPRWMEGDPSYAESVLGTCPNCGSSDIWRGPWCSTPEIYLRISGEPSPVRCSGRTRHFACLSCGEFRSDIQAVAYELQEEVTD